MCNWYLGQYMSMNTWLLSPLCISVKIRNGGPYIPRKEHFFFYLGVSHLLVYIMFLPPLPVQLNHTQKIHSFEAAITFLDF